MKKIIDNKIYDTEKANVIYEFRRRLKGDECWFKPGYCFMYWTKDKVKELIKELNPDKYLELFGTIDLEEA